MNSIFLSIIWLHLACCNIVTLSNIKLAEKVLQSKSRYVFSDFARDPSSLLKDASIELDIQVMPNNYEVSDSENNMLRLYIIISETQTAK
jgi:hypothetical protein